ncbi:diacylglycerol kinase family protein [Novosphingobium lentum]|uniref:diacylglycerol kinase family protein n=1 Tax=Novosphingobium lentum TaxID=145287 RepID=UPI00082A8B8A|nr:diacylglycerol kinase family protein [Novosphingobium lentum]
MDDGQTWLVVNAASGSNTPEALANLTSALRAIDRAPGRVIRFPDEALPDPAKLRAHGVGTVAVFAGDGTINALVTGLYGWDGAVLVLPGGTMNLLALRLHGDADAEAIVARVGAAPVRRKRISVIRSAHGDALGGLLLGPGTAWNDVREALRSADIRGVAEHTAAAIGQSTTGPMVVCSAPPLGRPEGYPLVNLTPTAEGIRVEAYYAASIADYARQGLALLRRSFRDGPHDDLELHRELELSCLYGAPIELLVDGEPAEGTTRETFMLAQCEVDLIATRHAD